MRRLILASTLLLVLAARCPAQEARPAPPGAEDARNKAIERYVGLQQRIATAFRERRYAEAEKTCREMIRIVPDGADAHYNLACALSRQNKKAEALKALAKSVQLGFLDVKHMKEDEDLAPIRGDPEFEKLAAQMETRRKVEFDGKVIPGLMTMTGIPEGGLRYRIRISPRATKMKPHRLIVWLHPSGGSMNDGVETLAPMFARSGFALMVLVEKEFLGWTDEDQGKIMKTVEAVKEIEGIQAARPCLLGYSAGGQAALDLWHKKPGDFSGIILDAAYPIGFEGEKRVMLEPPNDPAVRKTPVFVAVGEKDGGALMWKAKEESWRAAGVPLTTLYVPGKGHAWLFGQEQTEQLEKWLRRL